MEVKMEKQEKNELDVIIAYAQLAYHTLNNSGSEINAKSIRNEVKMFYNKFGNTEVLRLTNIIIKEKK